MSANAPSPVTTPDMLNAVARELRNLREAANQGSESHSVFDSPASNVNANFDPTLSRDIEQLLRTVSNPAHAAGRMPPEPPTLRGRTGALLVRIVQRCLFWYTDQINEIFHRIGDLFRRVALQLSRLEQERAGERQSLQDLARQVASLNQAVKSIREDLAASGNSIARARQELSAVRDSLQSNLNEVRESGRIALHEVRESWRVALENERAEIRQEFGAALSGALQDQRLVMENDLESKLAALRELWRKAELFAHQTRAILHAQESRISVLMRKSSHAGNSSAVTVSERPADIACDELGPVYLAFENAFRGTRSEIKERASEYLPLVTAKQLGTPQTPVLDLGCGRGEWLELLAENGLTAVGVDSNESFARECRVRGLDVRTTDALSFLEELPDQSQGAVTAFHVVEHMPFRTILDLLDQSVRVLKPGGLLILETPNPANLTVGAHTFYLDPTHLRPLPADLLRFFVESRGFCSVDVRPLHPFPDSFRLNGEANSAAAVLNDLIYGARDYAIVAERA